MKKSDRERQIPYDITCMWNLKYDTNELIYETDTNAQAQKRLVVANGKEAGGGMMGFTAWLAETDIFMFIYLFSWPLQGILSFCSLLLFFC